MDRSMEPDMNAYFQDGTAAPATPHKVGLFADTHYADEEAIGSRRPRQSLDKVTRMAEYFRGEGVSIVVCLGDLINACEDREKDTEAVRRIMQPLNDAGFLTYLCLGNHDTEALSQGDFCAAAGALSAPAMLRLGELQLLMLDFCWRRNGTQYEPGTNDWTDTACPEEELKWLEKELRMADGEVVVLSHQPLTGEEGDPHVIANAAEVRAVLGKYGNVRRVFSGHRHHGGYEVVDGIEYTTLRALCEDGNDDVKALTVILEG